MRASRKVAKWGRRQQRGDKGNGDGDKIKQIGHVQREHRLTINCELSKKQRASAANTGRGQGTCDTRNRTNRTNRTKMQSKVWPSLSMICACLYDMKHIPHSRACNFMCAEDVDTDTDTQIHIHWQLQLLH